MAAPAAASFDSHRVPVTIITGFLGAGKTTLLNHLLAQARGRSKRIAVVENELGAVNIDGELGESKRDCGVSVTVHAAALMVCLPRPAVSETVIAKEDVVALQNGCVCCSLRKDIVRALTELDKRSHQNSARFDAVVLETTGLADPAPVAFTFFANPWIAAHYKLDSIL